MNFDFCDISSVCWYAIGVASLIGGACFGMILQWLFKGAGFNPYSSRIQTLTGGCMLPVFFGLACTMGFYSHIPPDPCGGANTPDAFFVFEVILPVSTLAAIAAFFAMIWRR